MSSKKTLDTIKGVINEFKGVASTVKGAAGVGKAASSIDDIVKAISRGEKVSDDALKGLSPIDANKAKKLLKAREADTPTTDLAPSPTKPEPKITPKPEPEVAAKTSPAPKGAPSTTPKPAEAPKGEAPTKPVDKKPAAPSAAPRGVPKGSPKFSLPWSPGSDRTSSTKAGRGPSIRQHMHMAEPYMEETDKEKLDAGAIEANKERRDVEVVARANNLKSKLTRQAEYKKKIIDESKKKADTVRKVVKDKKDDEPGRTKVIINPTLNREPPGDIVETQRNPK